jgi:hypothetical protein
MPGIHGRGEGIGNPRLPLQWEVVVSIAHDHSNGAWGAAQCNAVPIFSHSVNNHHVQYAY